MTLIKINKESIRENPHAGKSVFYQNGPISKTKTVYKGKTCDRYMVNPDTGEETMISVGERCKEHRNGTVIETNFNSLPLHTLTPQPKWLFEYLPTEVQCKACEARFTHDKLKEDWDAINICPECNTWYCCEIQYETIN